MRNEFNFTIIPSECYENNPLSAIESLSMGIPIIGTNIGGIPELVNYGRNGYLFEPKDSKRLSMILESTSRLSDKDYWELSNNAREFAENNLSISAHYNKLMEIYNNIIR